MNTVPISFTLRPLAYIRVPKNPFPYALAFFQPALPLALVQLPIEPAVDALAVWLIVLKFALVLIPIAVAFHASAIPVVVQPLPFVQPGCFVDTDA